MKFELKSNWPPGAWIVSVRSNQSPVFVKHGRRVEVNGDWFGEIIWNGDYETGGFDQTDIVFGTGARLVSGSNLDINSQASPNKINFVTSASTLDRLHWAKFGDQWFVSNSLVCLLAESGASIAPNVNYSLRFQAILNGIDQPVPGIPTDLGTIHLTYYRNLRWDGFQVTEIDKPFVARNGNSFPIYRSFLETELSACALNASSTQRKFPYSLLGTISSGFDSPTVSALGKAAGLEHVATISSSRSGLDDSGEKIATRLGLKTTSVSRDAWKLHRYPNIPFPEIPFIAADGKGEDVYFGALTEHLEGKVLLTGYCGSVWGGRSRRYYELRRTDPSGLSLSEFRLWAGFINFPVPLMGVYHADDLIELMSSEEASKWATGNSYDKPFSRFVLSSKGVPDDWYGVEKKAASVLLEDRGEFLSSQSAFDFESKKSRYQSLQRRCLIDPASEIARNAVSGFQAISNKTGQLSGIELLKRIGNSSRLYEYARGDTRFRYLFPWAISHAIQKYR